MSHQYDPIFNKAKAKKPLRFCPMVFVSFLDVEVFLSLFSLQWTFQFKDIRVLAYIDMMMGRELIKML
jgi:hypothetical protein